LLPKIEDNNEEELDPEYVLKLRLREYQMFKEVNEKLKTMESNDKFYKAPEKEATKKSTKKTAKVDAEVKG
jgi:chromatin segregation and condensation protein Rec8/ScpA/Scc1 (kleisin family)